MKFSQLDVDLITKYNVNGPRYTSYPTALQFGSLSSAEYKQAVADSVYKDRDLSLYFHLPFCNTICYYCACNKIVTKDKSRAAHYLELLKLEIDQQAPLFTGRKVSQLHWGGGTPTFLNDGEIKELMDAITNHFSMTSDELGEFSIEVDPRTVDPARIGMLRETGFNRLSMGIQDFNPDVQKAVNRLQSVEDTTNVIQAARVHGFRSISVDLMYGLPHQTTETVSRTLEEVIKLDPDRISIYNYAHLPERFKSQRRIDALEVPSAATKLELLILCISRLHDAGYVYIGMDHFAKPDDELAIAQRKGTLHRNFQGYSTFADCDLIAMGITGISSVGNFFAQNTKDLEAYEKLIRGGNLATEKGVSVDEDDQIRRAVIMQLICQFELDYDAFDQRFNFSFEQYFANEIRALNDLALDGLLSIDNRHIKISPVGRLLSRNICMIFDRYINQQTDNQRFSKAI